MIVPCEAVVGFGTTASCVAPGRDGLVVIRRAPASGTAPEATTEFGSAPQPGHLVESRGRCQRAEKGVGPASRGEDRTFWAGDGAPTATLGRPDRIDRG